MRTITINENDTLLIKVETPTGVLYFQHIEATGKELLKMVSEKIMKDKGLSTEKEGAEIFKIAHGKSEKWAVHDPDKEYVSAEDERVREEAYRSYQKGYIDAYYEYVHNR